MNIIAPEILLQAYSQGIFPMAESKDDEEVDWYSASQRGIIPIEGFHASKNLRRLIRQHHFEVKVNNQFRAVVKACADRPSTWINDLIINSYDVLHQAGHAHSVEIYKENALVGGLYGVTLQGAFFGESMFQREKEMDKVALYYCHQVLKENGFVLWDTQFYTDHLAQFGCIEIDAEEYEARLDRALEVSANFRLPA